MRRWSFFEEAPLDDDMVVLDLLVHGWNDQTRRFLHCRQPPVRVEIEHFYKDGDLAEIDTFHVTQGVADRLLKRRLVRGKPEWGYSDKTKLEATEFGERTLWEERRRLGPDVPRMLAWVEYARWHVHVPPRSLAEEP